MRNNGALKKLLSVLLASVCVLGLVGCNNVGKGGESGKESEKEEDRVMTNHAVYDGVVLPDSLWEAPQVIYNAEKDRTDVGINGSIQALYYRSDYKGEESYAFAYLGIPEGASATEKVPAVLLLHGGGGTAYWHWVKEWVNRGYVALAMDLEGHVPLESGHPDKMPQELYTQSEYTAPHNQNYGDAAKPIEETWMYYAVSTAIKGNSLLHRLEMVNKNKIGVCGVSWGGVITGIVSGYDDRFAFAIPIYGSLNNAESSGNLASYYKNHPAAKVWDDDEGLSRVETPMLFLQMNNDVSFFPDSIMYTAQRCKNVHLSYVHNWLHSHSHAFARQEPYAFADEIVGKGESLVKITGKTGQTGGTLSLEIPKGTSVKYAYIMVTNSDMKTIPTWGFARLPVENGKISYEITEELKSFVGGEITYYYVYVEDNLGRVASTNLIQLT